MSKRKPISEISKLLQSFEELSSRFKKLETEVIVLRIENKRLLKENKQLKERVATLEHKKNSSNSSMPPSSDMVKPKRTQSLRESSGKKLGGQLGHKGKTLKMHTTPDCVKDYYPTICEHCGKDLSEIEADFSGKRQIIDIPPIRQVVTEHRIYSKKCTCGTCTKSKYPQLVKSPVSYGSNIQALVTYLSARQYLPINRIHELFSDVLNVNISEGGICYLLDKMAKKGKLENDRIKAKVKQEKVIGAD